VILPALAAPSRLRRVERMYLGWLDQSRRLVVPVGCVFCQVSAEVGARPGPVRDAVVTAYQAWIGELERSIEQARELGEIAAVVTPAQLAFELDALVRAANNRGMLRADDSAHELARTAIDARLTAVAGE